MAIDVTIPTSEPEREDERQLEDWAKQVQAVLKRLADAVEKSSKDGLSIGDIDGLEAALATKVPADHDHDLKVEDIEELSSTLDALQAALKDRAGRDHDHDVADIADLQKRLDEYQAGLLGMSGGYKERGMGNIEEWIKKAEGFLRGIIPCCGCFAWFPLWTIGCCQECRPGSASRVGVSGKPTWHEWKI